LIATKGVAIFACLFRKVDKQTGFSVPTIPDQQFARSAIIVLKRESVKEKEDELIALKHGIFYRRRPLSVESKYWETK